MPDPAPNLSAALARAREDLRRALDGVDFLCRGTLVKRTKVCGKSSCPCAHDPTARHGPYYEWGRMDSGRLVHTMVSPQQAAQQRNWREPSALTAKFNVSYAAGSKNLRGQSS